MLFGDRLKCDENAFDDIPRHGNLQLESVLTPNPPGTLILPSPFSPATHTGRPFPTVILTSVPPSCPNTTGTAASACNLVPTSNGLRLTPHTAKNSGCMVKVSLLSGPEGRGGEEA